MGCNDCLNKLGSRCCHATITPVTTINQIRASVPVLKPQWHAHGIKLGAKAMSANNGINHQFQRSKKCRNYDKCISDACKDRTTYERLRCGAAMLSVWIMILVVTAVVLYKVFAGTP